MGLNPSFNSSIFDVIFFFHVGGYSLFLCHEVLSAPIINNNPKKKNKVLSISPVYSVIFLMDVDHGELGNTEGGTPIGNQFYFFLLGAQLPMRPR